MIEVPDDLKEAANEVFAEIARAHEVLSDADKRVQYEASLGGESDSDAQRVAEAEASYVRGEQLMRAGNFRGALEFLERAVVLWRVIIPILLFGIGFWLIFSQLAAPYRYLPWLINLPLSAAAGGLLVYHYERLYGQHAPQHYTWARFLAAEVKLRSAAKLAWIEETFRWKL